jgi:hypothetical protein
MSRQFFHQNNRQGGLFNLTTSAATGVNFFVERWNNDYSINDPLKEVRIDWGDGSLPEAYNASSMSHTYTASTLKTIGIDFGNLNEVHTLDIDGNELTGNLDLTGLKKVIEVKAQNNEFTGVTFDVDGTTSGLTGNDIRLYQNNIKDIDLTGFKQVGAFYAAQSSNANGMFTLTGITIPNGLAVDGIFQISGTNLKSINGVATNNHLDFSFMENVGSSFQFAAQSSKVSSITGITFPTTDKDMSSSVFSYFWFGTGGNLAGEIDLSPLQNLHGVLFMSKQINLTNLIFPSNNLYCNRLSFNGCNFTNLDFSPLSGFGFTNSSTAGMQLVIDTNPNLTAITTTAGVNTFATGTQLGWFEANNCDLTGTLDMSGVEWFSTIAQGGDSNNYFWLQGNNNLSEVINGSGNVGRINYGSIPLTYIDISNLSGSTAAGILNNYVISSSSVLTSFTQTIGNDPYRTSFCFSNTKLKELNISNYVKPLGIELVNNDELTGVTFPTSTASLSSMSNVCGGAPPSSSEWYITNCTGLTSLDFKIVSGMTVANTAGIYLAGNSWGADTVNRILTDFDSISAVRSSGATWTGCTLNIAGNNAAPDGTSGGYDGLAALSNLTGSPINWTVTTT